MYSLSLENSAWWALPSGCDRQSALGSSGSGRSEVAVGDVGRVGRVGDVQLHVAAVPVREQHDLAAVDLLDDHVVEERLAVPLPAWMICGNCCVQVVLGDQHRVTRVGDVHDVDVGALLVVDQHRVGRVAGVPGKRAVDGVRDRGAVEPPPG